LGLTSGLAARDTLCLEMGFCLAGNDYQDSEAAHEKRVIKTLTQLSLSRYGERLKHPN
jgi:glycine cleavage system aminomethyltransferase T